MKPADLDLITTAELLAVLKTSKKALASLRACGLKQLGEGKQKFYHRPDVVRAMRLACMLRALRGDDEGDEP